MERFYLNPKKNLYFYRTEESYVVCTLTNKIRAMPAGKQKRCNPNSTIKSTKQRHVWYGLVVKPVSSTDNMEPPNEAFDRCVDLFDSRGKKMETASEIRYLLQPGHLTSFHSLGQRTIVSDFFIVKCEECRRDTTLTLSFSIVHSVTKSDDIANPQAYPLSSSPKVWNYQWKEMGWRNFHPVF